MEYLPKGSVDGPSGRIHNEPLVATTRSGGSRSTRLLTGGRRCHRVPKLHPGIDELVGIAVLPVDVAGGHDVQHETGPLVRAPPPSAAGCVRGRSVTTDASTMTMTMTMTITITVDRLPMDLRVDDPHALAGSAAGLSLALRGGRRQGRQVSAGNPPESGRRTAAGAAAAAAGGGGGSSCRFRRGGVRDTAPTCASVYLPAHPKGRAPQEIGELLVARSIGGGGRAARSLLGPVASIVVGAAPAAALLPALKQLRPQEERLGKTRGFVPPALHAEDGGGGGCIIGEL